MTQHIGQIRLGQNIPGASGVFASIISPVPGKLTGATIKLAGGANINGVANFRLLIEGVTVGTLVVNPGQVLASLTLDQAVAQFEEIKIDAPLIPEGGILAPLFFILTFEDTQGAIKRGGVVYNTPALANNATDSSVIQLGRGFIAYRIATNAPARVRLYTRQSYRTADLSRPFGTPPVGESGLILDVETAPDNLAIDLNNPVTGANLEDVVTDDIACSVTNLSGLNQIIQVTITRAVIEGVGASSGFAIEIAEQDGAPDLTASKLIVGNGDLIPVSPGVLRLKTASDVAIPPTGIVVQEQDGAPDLMQVLALVVGNGDLADLGGGAARLKTAADVAIPGSLPPSGAAGGDLAGNYPNPSIALIRGRSFAGIPLPLAAISDNFDDNVLDVSLWGQLDPSSPAVETGGHIVAPASGGATGLYLLSNKNCNGHTTAVQVVSRGGDAYILWRAGGYDILMTARSSGVFWPFIYGPSGFVYNGPQATPVTDGDYIRLRHDAGGNVIYFERSSNGGATWYVEGNFALSGSGIDISSSTIQIRQLAGSGPTIFDNFSSDFADPIADLDKYAIIWDNPNNHFGLKKILGVVPSVGATPVGAPAGHVAGYSEVVHDKVNHKLWFWNENTGHWDGITLPDAS